MHFKMDALVLPGELGFFFFVLVCSSFSRVLSVTLHTQQTLFLVFSEQLGCYGKGSIHLFLLAQHDAVPLL